MKRNINIDHEIASTMLSVIVSFNLFTLLIISNLLKIISGYIPVGVPIIILFSTVYFINKGMFLRNDRYINIIESYNKEDKSRKEAGTIIIILISLSTFILCFLAGWVKGRSH